MHYVCNEHNAVTEIHAFLERLHSTVAASNTVRSRTVQTTLQGQPRNPSMDSSSAYALYFMSPWKTALLVSKTLVAQ